MKKVLYKVIVMDDYADYFTYAFSAGEAEQKVKEYVTRERAKLHKKDIPVLSKDGSVNPALFEEPEIKPVTVGCVSLVSGVIVN